VLLGSAWVSHMRHALTHVEDSYCTACVYVNITPHVIVNDCLPVCLPAHLCHPAWRALTRLPLGLIIMTLLAIIQG
jgi:hypothetical protein